MPVLFNSTVWNTPNHSTAHPTSQQAVLDKTHSGCSPGRLLLQRWGPPRNFTTHSKPGPGTELAATGQAGVSVYNSHYSCATSQHQAKPPLHTWSKNHRRLKG